MKNPTDKVLPVSPFTDNYWKGEIAFLNLPARKTTCGSVTVDWTEVSGRCDDYLNMNFRPHSPLFPRLFIDGTLWMSLTASEVQSHALAIHRAEGVVVAGGLGLGYFALRAAAKPEVKQVLVFERSPDVIKWFCRAYKKRPELAKIDIWQADMRKEVPDWTLSKPDLVYVDIYESLCPDETLSDFKLFTKAFKPKRYHFWGWERPLLCALLSKNFSRYPGNLFREQAALFRTGRDFLSLVDYWLRHPINKSYAASQLAALDIDPDYVVKAVKLMSQFNPL